MHGNGAMGPSIGRITSLAFAAAPETDHDRMIAVIEQLEAY